VSSVHCAARVSKEHHTSRLPPRIRRPHAIARLHSKRAGPATMNHMFPRAPTGVSESVWHPSPSCRRRRLEQTDHTAWEHRARLHHMARHICELGAVRPAARGAQSAAASRRQQALRQSYAAGSSSDGSQDPWLSSTERSSGGRGGGRPRTAPARAEGSTADGLRRSAEWAWAVRGAAAAAAAARGTEEAGRAEWMQLKQRRYPELHPPVQPIELPQSR
jgi:hypothetical protein